MINLKFFTSNSSKLNHTVNVIISCLLLSIPIKNTDWRPTATIVYKQFLSSFIVFVPESFSSKGQYCFKTSHICSQPACQPICHQSSALSTGNHQARYSITPNPAFSKCMALVQPSVITVHDWLLFCSGLPDLFQVMNSQCHNVILVFISINIQYESILQHKTTYSIN